MAYRYGWRDQGSIADNNQDKDICKDLGGHGKEENMEDPQASEERPLQHTRALGGGWNGGPRVSAEETQSKILRYSGWTSTPAPTGPAARRRVEAPAEEPSCWGGT